MSTQGPRAKRTLRLGNVEDLAEVVGIAEAVVGAFNEDVGELDPLHFIDVLVGQRQRAGEDAPPHVVVWLDLKKDELDDSEIALALATRYILDGRIPAAFDCTIDVYWRHTGEFTPMLGGSPACKEDYLGL